MLGGTAGLAWQVLPAVICVAPQDDCGVGKELLSLRDRVRARLTLLAIVREQMDKVDALADAIGQLQAIESTVRELILVDRDSEAQRPAFPPASGILKQSGQFVATEAGLSGLSDEVVKADLRNHGMGMSKRTVSGSVGRESPWIKQDADQNRRYTLRCGQLVGRLRTTCGRV